MGRADRVCGACGAAVAGHPPGPPPTAPTAASGSGSPTPTPATPPAAPTTATPPAAQPRGTSSPPRARWDDHPAVEHTAPSRDGAGGEHSGHSFSSATTVPWASASTPPADIISSVPGFTRAPDPAPAAPDAPAVSAVPDSPAATRWRIELDSGEEFDLTRPLVLGRNPLAQPDERAVAVTDGTRTVSKTHLRIELRDGVPRVTDLHSTNGVAVVADTAPEVCDPGVPIAAPAGATVRFGNREFRVRS